MVEKDEKKEETSLQYFQILMQNYLRNNLNLRGSGIKVGIVEINYADKSNSQLNDRNIISFDVSRCVVASQDTGSHATKVVASIIVGRTQVSFRCYRIYDSSFAKNRLEDYEKIIEWLMDQGVSVLIIDCMDTQ